MVLPSHSRAAGSSPSSCVIVWWCAPPGVRQEEWGASVLNVIFGFAEFGIFK